MFSSPPWLLTSIPAPLIRWSGLELFSVATRPGLGFANGSIRKNWAGRKGAHARKTSSAGPLTSQINVHYDEAFN